MTMADLTNSEQHLQPQNYALGSEPVGQQSWEEQFWCSSKYYNLPIHCQSVFQNFDNIYHKLNNIQLRLDSNTATRSSRSEFDLAEQMFLGSPQFATFDEVQFVNDFIKKVNETTNERIDNLQHELNLLKLKVK